MSELSDEARALLAREAPFDEPTPAELERGRHQVFAALGIPLPPVVGVPTPDPVLNPTPAVASTGLGGGIGLKLFVASLAVGSVVAGVVYSKVPEPVPRAGPATVQPAAPSVAAPSIQPEAVTEPTPLPPPVVAPVPVTPRPERIAAPRPETPSDALARESMLVAAAEAQLRAGHPSEALSLFDRYLREHPSGALRHESLAGRIASLCRLGRTEAGRAELARFAERFPRSPSLPRLRSACNVEE